MSTTSESPRQSLGEESVLVEKWGLSSSEITALSELGITGPPPEWLPAWMVPVLAREAVLYQEQATLTRDVLQSMLRRTQLSEPGESGASELPYT